MAVKPTIAITFIDSLFFNNTMRIVNNETSEITVRFYPGAFEISFGNDLQSAAHHIEFYPEELQEYVYNARDTAGELLPHLCLTFQVVDLFKVIDGIRRHESIRMLYYEGDMALLVHPLDSASGCGEGTNHIVNLKLKHLPPVDFSAFADDQPTGRMYTGHFSSLCTAAIKRRVSYIEISQRGDNLRFVAYLANHTMAFSQEGKIRPASDEQGALVESEPEELVEGQSVRVPLPTIKSLCKLHSITSAGTLMRFYFEAGKPVRIACAIGTIGIYNVVLRSIDMKKKSKRT